MPVTLLYVSHLYRYHPSYNISFWGIEKLHPFDACKFSKVVAGLAKAGHLRRDQVGHVTPRVARYIPKKGRKELDQRCAVDRLGP